MAKALNDNFPGYITTLDCIPHQKRFIGIVLMIMMGQNQEELLMKWENELKIIFIQGWTDEILASLGMLS